MKKAMVQAAVIVTAGTMGAATVMMLDAAPQAVRAADNQSVVKVTVQMHDVTNPEPVLYTLTVDGKKNGSRVTISNLIKADWTNQTKYDETLGNLATAINGQSQVREEQGVNGVRYVLDYYAVSKSRTESLGIHYVDADSGKILKQESGVGTNPDLTPGYVYAHPNEPGLGFEYKDTYLEIEWVTVDSQKNVNGKTTDNAASHPQSPADIKSPEKAIEGNQSGVGVNLPVHQTDTASVTDAKTTLGSPTGKANHTSDPVVAFMRQFEPVVQNVHAYKEVYGRLRAAALLNETLVKEMTALKMQHLVSQGAVMARFMALAAERQTIARELDAQKERTDRLAVLLSEREAVQRFVTAGDRARQQQLLDLRQKQQQEIKQYQDDVPETEKRLQAAYRDLLRIQAGVIALRDQTTMQNATPADAKQTQPEKPTARAEKTARTVLAPAKFLARLDFAGVVTVGHSGGVLLDANQQPTTRSLTPGTRWRCFGLVTRDGHAYYDLGGGQYLRADAGQLKLTDATAQAKQPVTFSGVVTINYVPGYGVQLWHGDGTMVRDDQGRLRKLAHGSRWHAFSLVVRGGHLYYALGGDQYVDAAFGTLG